MARPPQSKWNQDYSQFLIAELCLRNGKVAQTAVHTFLLRFRTILSPTQKLHAAICFRFRPVCPTLTTFWKRCRYCTVGIRIMQLQNLGPSRALGILVITSCEPELFQLFKWLAYELSNQANNQWEKYSSRGPQRNNGSQVKKEVMHRHNSEQADRSRYRTTFLQCLDYSEYE